MSLELRPCDFRTACEFVGDHHRHNKPPVSHKFSIACYDGDRLCGVCIVGRPISRRLDDGLTLEVNRCCTDGTRNACTILYGAACRAAQALGYKRIITYTLVSEPGSSLKASNWTCDGQMKKGTYTSARYDLKNAQIEIDMDGKIWDRTVPVQKIRWHRDL